MNIGTRGLNKYLGSVGEVGGNDFSNIVDLLEKWAVLTQEEEEASVFCDYIDQKYITTDEKEIYTLWYQVKTPNTPQDYVLQYGFVRYDSDQS